MIMTKEPCPEHYACEGPPDHKQSDPPLKVEGLGFPKETISIKIELLKEDDKIYYGATIKFDNGDEQFTYGDSEAFVIAMAAEVVGIVKNICVARDDGIHCYCRPGNPHGGESWGEGWVPGGMTCCYCEMWHE